MYMFIIFERNYHRKLLQKTAEVAKAVLEDIKVAVNE
jgi:hypothetical protein